MGASLLWAWAGDQENLDTAEGGCGITAYTFSKHFFPQGVGWIYRGVALVCILGWAFFVI